ncbi:unnamed protein product [Ixodes pacificus]
MCVRTRDNAHLFTKWARNSFVDFGGFLQKEVSDPEHQSLAKVASQRLWEMCTVLLSVYGTAKKFARGGSWFTAFIGMNVQPNVCTTHHEWNVLGRVVLTRKLSQTITSCDERYLPDVTVGIMQSIWNHLL